MTESKKSLVEIEKQHKETSKKFHDIKSTGDTARLKLENCILQLRNIALETEVEYFQRIEKGIKEKISDTEMKAVRDDYDDFVKYCDESIKKLKDML